MGSSDRARRSYDAGRMYRRIVSQQGRVTVEADANEGEEIRAEELRADLIDVIGPQGAPADGFKITVPPRVAGFDFLIGVGALYVGGMRVVNTDHHATYKRQLPPPPDALAPATEEPSVREWFDYPAGRLAEEPTGSRTELVYLALTEREVSAVEDPALREPALGGPDTAARTRLVQRIQRYPTDVSSGCSAAFIVLLRSFYDRGTAFNEATMRLESRARLRVDFLPDSNSGDPCEPTAQAGFLGTDNQLIRVQVSNLVDNRQTFLWGWDNASSLDRVSIVTAGAAKALKLDATAVDTLHRPRKGQWIELLNSAVKLDDDAWIASETGLVAQIDEYDSDERIVTLTTFPASFQEKGQTFIRLWENQLSFATDDTTPVELVQADGKSTGVRIYAKGPWIPGDYWMIGVRPSVPMDILPARLKSVRPQPPDGPGRWVAPLAVINWTADGARVSDCRPPFLDLVELTQRKSGSCEIVVAPGEDIQEAIDSLPNDGGAVCLKAGTHHIDKPLLITRPFVTLHGESGGTIVTVVGDGTEISAMLDIQGAGPDLARRAIDPTQILSDVVVRDISFVMTKVPSSGAIVRISGAKRAQIRGCRFIAPQADQSNVNFDGISADGCEDLTIADNTAERMSVGITASGCMGQVDILRNVLIGLSFATPPDAGTSKTFVIGLFGIRIAGASISARARVEHNRLDNFQVGVVLWVNLARSTIADNTIRRALFRPPNGFTFSAFPAMSERDQMNGYLSSLFYAVQCNSDDCAIRGNRIDLISSPWGGIHATGYGTSIDANLIESIIEVAQDPGLPAAIRCELPPDPPLNPLPLLVRDNVLAGPQAAIAITDWGTVEMSRNHVEVSRNHIDGWGKAAHGVRLDGISGALIRDNVIVRMSADYPRPAIFVGDGQRNRIESNHIDTCSLGIMAPNQTDVAILGNHIEEAGVVAIWVEPFDRTATICDNRLLRCGSYIGASDPSVGIKVVGSGPGSTLRVEGCEVVDFSIPAIVGPGRVVGIRVDNVAGCQLVGNRVGYTDSLLKSLDPRRARQPLLVGGLSIFGDNAPGDALITDNDLTGTAFLNDTAQPPENGLILVKTFKKIAFSNNICRERNDVRGNAARVAPTVRLTGKHLIAMGNHVEAYDPDVNANDPAIVSIELAGSQKNVLMGNATSGPLVPPAPDPNFNVIL